jgi:hypothetical protein
MFEKMTSGGQIPICDGGLLSRIALERRSGLLPMLQKLCIRPVAVAGLANLPLPFSRARRRERESVRGLKRGKCRDGLVERTYVLGERVQHAELIGLEVGEAVETRLRLSRMASGRPHCLR